jgi:double zinc ribbon protein
MVDTPPTKGEKRCVKCGAVLYEGVAWCGMCFEPVAPERATEQEPDAEPTAAAPVATTVAEPDVPTVPMWPCPVCEARNPMELDFCATCGASFASLMRQEKARVRVDPRAAFRRSLMFPGLGHRMIPGREVDGFARGVLFAMLLVATLMLGLSGVHAGAVQFLFLVYLTSSVLVYVLTAFEASRLAEGGEPLVSSRALLWATVGILIMSIIVVALVIGTAARR